MFLCLAHSPVTNYLHFFHISLPRRIISLSSVLDSLINILRFVPVSFPIFRRGVSIPDLTAARHLPVVALVSAFSPSSPTLFLVFHSFGLLFDFFGGERSFHFGWCYDS